MVIVRRDLLERAGQPRAPIFNYAEHAAHDSMLNTPPTWNWYLLGLTVRWMLDQGGVEEFARRSAAKAACVYAAIDGSGGFYRNQVVPGVRSRMNVPFFLPDPTLTDRFVAESAAAGLIEMALAAGATPDRISFGNTIKKERDIARALELGIRLFAVDCEAEVEKIVKIHAGAKKAEADKKNRKKANHTSRWLEINGDLGVVQQKLGKVLNTADGVPFTDEEIELISASLGKVRALIGLIDLRISGETDIDWDAEFQKLTV